MKHLPIIKLTSELAEWFREKVSELLQLLENLVEDETDALFPGILLNRELGIKDSLTIQTRQRFFVLQKAYCIVKALEEKITSLLEISEDRVADTYSDAGWPWSEVNSIPEETLPEVLKCDPLSPEIVPIELGPVSGRYRFEMKLSHYLHAAIERYASRLNTSPIAVCQLFAERALPTDSAIRSHTSSVIAYLLGCVFGRWDIRYATGENTKSSISDAFAALPPCPPGMLQDNQGLPARFIDVPDSYPITVAWSGILVDDEGHTDDIVNRAYKAIKVIWREKDGDIEQEVCEILKVSNLRDYFRKPAGFFDDHLSRYSKSRRQAPIYLPLSTASGSYTLWLYYHRLTDQTLYTCINDYVEPKLNRVSETVKFLRGKTTRTRDEENGLEDLQTLEDELTKFRDELLRAAKLPWKPNLYDGVQITIAPLHSLFRLSKWQKKLKETWDKLEKGDYDWAHLAHSIWAARVREKCRTDKSLAIAHGLEDLYESPPETPKRTKRKKKE